MPSISYNNKPLHVQCSKDEINDYWTEILEKNPTNLTCEPINNDFSFYDFFSGYR